MMPTAAGMALGAMAAAGRADDSETAWAAAAWAAAARVAARVAAAWAAAEAAKAVQPHMPTWLCCADTRRAYMPCNTS